MNLFATPMSAPDADKITTCERSKVAWNKGICHLDESAKKRISEARKNLKVVTGKYVRTSDVKDKQREKSSIPVMTPDGIFSSKGEAAEFYGIHRNNFTIRMKKFPEQYYALVERNNKGNSTKGLNRKGGRV